MRSPSPIVLLACSLVVASLFSGARPAVAQSQGECVLPDGVTPPPPPRVTAQQVEDGSATLQDFVVAVRDQYSGLSQNAEAPSLHKQTYLGCLIRQEGSAYRSGSTFLVLMSPGSRLIWHATAMRFSGRRLDLPIYQTILFSLGVERSVLAGLASPDPEARNMAFAAAKQTLAQEPDGPFDATTPIPGLRPGFPGAAGHAAAYDSVNLGVPVVLLAGFDINESHVATEEIDYGNPTVTAMDVVDRDSLKAFVTQAGNYYIDLRQQQGGDFLQAKVALRDENGPWRHGSVYLYILDRISNTILLHAAFPDRFELRPLVATVRDAVTGELILPQVIEAAKSSPDGGFVEYYFDDPTDDTDSADVPKVGYAREFIGQIQRTDGATIPVNIIVGSGFYGRAPGTDMMTTFVPVVLDSKGKSNSHFTSELALTNRGSEAAMLNYTYTAKAGGGSGTATDMLGPHQQMIVSNAIDYLRGLEVPIPETGSRIGTLRVDVSGSSDTSVVVRTTTAVPEGRAGLAYLGVPENGGFHDEAVYLCGLRDNPGDRSNVAVQNMGGPDAGSITLRITVFSGNPTDPTGEMLHEDTLEPGEFHQFNEVLRMAGKADPMFGGYVKVERVEGSAPFYAYGVINDNANSDGSFVFPVSAASLEGALVQTLPAVVEINQFSTELTLTNFSGQPKSVRFSATHDRIETEDNTAGFGPVPMLPGQQLIIPHALAYARQNLGLDVPTGLVAPLIASAIGGDLSGIVIGARVVAPADAQDPSQGQYGVFYTAVPQGRGFTGSAWVDGLQQNEENRSNLALINTGEVNDQDIVFEIDIYDGETATLSQDRYHGGGAHDHVVPAKGFKSDQPGMLGKHAPGTTQGYIRIRKVSGANPFLAYGVVNDGGAPGQRTGDGAYIPARE